MFFVFFIVAKFSNWINLFSYFRLTLYIPNTLHMYLQAHDVFHLLGSFLTYIPTYFVKCCMQRCIVVYSMRTALLWSWCLSTFYNMWCTYEEVHMFFHVLTLLYVHSSCFTETCTSISTPSPRRLVILIGTFPVSYVYWFAH